MKWSENPLIVIPMAAAALLPAFTFLGLSYFTEDGSMPFVGLEGGIICAALGCMALYLLSKTYPLTAAYPSIVVGMFLVAKPKLAPVIYISGGAHPFPFLSETHLYFIIPGALLLAACFIYVVKRGEG